MKIYDSVHGFIRFNEIESKLIDSFPFQRLHYIHQLGIAYLVYPGGTHSRFEHSLGVMQLATRIFDAIVADYPLPDNPTYWRQMVRLAALCHDLGHLPFSHVAEKALLGKGGHEKWTLEVIRSHYLQPVFESLFHEYKKEIIEDLIKLSIGEQKLLEMGMNPLFTPWERVLSEIITGDFFGADRIDYLVRDAQCTGVAYGLIDYDQLIETLRILPYKERLELGIEENGIESCEALLLARHFMHRRVYQYSTAKAYSFHLMRFMKQWYADKEMNNLDYYLWMTDNEILSAVAQAARSGNKDGIALFTRQHRFKAIEMVEGMVENDLIRLRNELSLSEESMDWEFSGKRAQKVGFSFPILKKNGTIIEGARSSDILIPSGPLGWIFITPEYESALTKKLR